METITHRIPGLILIDHEFNLPLDYSHPEGEQITIFARAVVAPDKEKDDLPWLLFLQGGPGFGSPRPEERNGWLKRALKEYRVLLLDQRGTGRSMPVLTQTLLRLSNPQAQAEYLKQFRADSIVKDAESIRRELIGESGRWSVLGQSYGGFCAVHYLSVAPQSLREVMLTGGLPPLDHPLDEVYRHTYRRVSEKNQQYYQRYPDDILRAQRIAACLMEKEVQLPAGGILTPHRFQQLGIAFGASNGLEQVHYLLEEAFVDDRCGGELSYVFLRGCENSQPFDTNPIYAILHEALYCQQQASNWSAERVRHEFPEFDLRQGNPVYFTGEMIYPWMFDEYQQLRPLKEAAQILAVFQGWPRLYDRIALQENQVPCAAAVYYNDMYVERIFSEDAAAQIKNLRMWVTSQYEHNALRAHGEDVLDKLLGLLHGEL